MQRERATPPLRDADEPTPHHREKDLRIPNTTPEQLAKALLSGGAKPRAETKRREAS